MNNLDSYDSSDLNDTIDDYYDCALVDSEVMNASTIDVHNDLLKPEAPIEPIPSIASSLSETFQAVVMLFLVPYLFFLFVGMVFTLIEWLLS